MTRKNTQIKGNKTAEKLVERHFRILELLADTPRGLRNAEISAILGLWKSTASNMLSNLVESGYLRRDNETKKYKLDIRVLSLGYQVMQDLQLREYALNRLFGWQATEGVNVRKVVIEHLNNIVSKLGLGAHIAILGRGDAIYVERVEGPGLILMATWIGRRMPPHITAVGKALMCHLDETEVKEVLIQHRNSHPGLGNKKIILKKLLAELEETRDRGWALDDCEAAPNVRCVAAPIRVGLRTRRNKNISDSLPKVVAAIGVSAPAAQLADEILPNVGGLIMSEAHSLSERLSSTRKR